MCKALICLSCLAHTYDGKRLLNSRKHGPLSTFEVNLDRRIGVERKPLESLFLLLSTALTSTAGLLIPRRAGILPFRRGAAISHSRVGALCLQGRSRQKIVRKVKKERSIYEKKDPDTQQWMARVDAGIEVDVLGRPDRDIGEEIMYLASGGQGGGRAAGGDQIVRVISEVCKQHPWKPWTGIEEDSRGSGFPILYKGDLRIMTSARLVADSTYIEVEKAFDVAGNGHKATVVKVEHKCDLALLAVDDEDFWEDVTPFEFGFMPYLQDGCTVVGYPKGRDGLSETWGTVARLSVIDYTHSGEELLAIQFAETIPRGSWGSPLLDEAGRVIGVAFDRVFEDDEDDDEYDDEATSYFVPVVTIMHFLKHVANANASSRACDGFCSLGFVHQELKSPTHRKFLEMPQDSTGILVAGFESLAPAKGFLEIGDVILEIDGMTISNDGSFVVAGQERLSYEHLIHMKMPGEKVSIRVWRKSSREEITVEFPVKQQEIFVPEVTYDTKQPYFLYGGALFLPLTVPYIDRMSEDSPSQKLLETVSDESKFQAGEAPVILSRTFISSPTAGYSDTYDRRVLAVNGERVTNIHQMYALVKRLHGEAEYLQFELQAFEGNVTMVIETKTACSPDVLQTYRIPTSASKDLLEQTGAIE